MNKSLPYVALWGLLLILALRMTMTETAHQTLALITGQVTAAAQAAGTSDPLPEIGPAVTTGLAAATFLLAGLAAWCGASAGAITRSRFLRLTIIAAVLTLAGLSTFHAANRFLALVGWCDLGMALLAGWALGLLCDRRMLGMTGRRTVIAAVVALAAVWTCKGIYQRTIDIPETIRYYHLHRDEALAQALGAGQSTDPNSAEVKLFESRMLSKEVTGYVTLSNVMATGMIGLLAVLTGLITARIVDGLETEEQAGDAPHETAPRRSGSTVLDDSKAHRPNEISWTLLTTSVAIVIGLGGIVALFLTASRGGSAAGVGAVVAVAAGAWFWRGIAARRRLLLTIAAVLSIAAAAALIGYGLKRDTMPERSLMFRWHYWTASASLVERSPLLGVGLNNFGDYYTEVKRASSPEDVKDPHSFFVRLATEIGLPATALIGALIVWLILASTRRTADPSTARWHVGNAIATGVGFCAVWWIAHQLLAEPPDEYSAILSTLAALIAAAAWAMACGIFSTVGQRGLRFIAVAGMVGALGMLAYDQINMALVTGPVAMFFWMLLGLAESWSSDPNDPRRPLRIPGKISGAMVGVTGVAIAVAIWWPTLQGTMPWDPLRYELEYLQAVQGGNQQPDFSAALSALNKAIALSPRSTDLLRQRVLVKLQLHQPVAADIREILALNPVSARLWMNLALSDSDLPLPERVAMLEKAIRLDDEFPPTEVMRLSAQEHAAIDAKLAALRKAIAAHG